MRRMLRTTVTSWLRIDFTFVVDDHLPNVLQVEHEEMIWGFHALSLGCKSIIGVEPGPFDSLCVRDSPLPIATLGRSAVLIKVIGIHETVVPYSRFTYLGHGGHLAINSQNSI